MEVKTVPGKYLPRGNLARRQTVKEIPNKGNFNVAFLGLLLCIMYSIPRSVIKTSMTVRLKNIQTEGEVKDDKGGKLNQFSMVKQFYHSIFRFSTN